MYFKRRRVLNILGAAGIASLAGCGSQLGLTGPSMEQTAKLTASDADADDRFGTTLDVTNDGSTAVIGARRVDNHIGAAYVFTKSNESWSEAAKLTPDENIYGGAFGGSVAVSSDASTVIIGAPKTSHSGKAYVLTKSDGSWSQQSELIAEDGEETDSFGTAVSVTGDGSTAIVSGLYAAYVFSRANGSWSQQTKLYSKSEKNAPRWSSDVEVSSDGSSIIAGTSVRSWPEEIAAIEFTQTNGSWSQQGELVVDDPNSLWRNTPFAAVSVSGDGTTAIIGNTGYHDGPEENMGGAYIFNRSDGSWTHDATLTANDGDKYDNFGSQVSLSADGRKALVAAVGDDDPNGAGSAYVFSEADGSWSQEVKLAADDGSPHDDFGWSIALSDDGSTGIVGAKGGGSAYVFE